MTSFNMANSVHQLSTKFTVDITQAMNNLSIADTTKQNNVAQLVSANHLLTENNKTLTEQIRK